MTLFAHATESLIPGGHAVVLTHMRPDGDAVGSAGAAAALLRAHGMSTEILIGQDEPLPADLAGLPADVTCRAQEDLPDCDLLLVCDCGSASRTGSFGPAIEQATHRMPVIVVDHHDSNPGYGTINIVAPEVESTCSLIWQWFNESGTDIDADTASLLYAGLVTDTGNFRFGRPEARTIAADLVAHGADAGQLVFDLIDAIPARDLALVGQVLASLSTHGEVALLTAPYAILSQGSVGLGERIIDFARGINDEGTTVVALLKENQPGVVTGSLRSRSRNVATIAQSLGGGGHVGAAGFTLHTDLDSAKEKLLAAVAAANDKR